MPYLLEQQLHLQAAACLHVHMQLLLVLVLQTPADHVLAAAVFYVGMLFSAYNTSEPNIMLRVA